MTMVHGTDAVGGRHACSHSLLAR